VARCDAGHGYKATTQKVFGEAAILRQNYTQANMDGTVLETAFFIFIFLTFVFLVRLSVFGSSSLSHS
jgi:hypothetical protein